MPTKPMIGVNMEYMGTTKDRPAYSVLAAGYYDRLLEAGAIPIAVPPLDNEDDLEAVLDRLDGFVMVGGRDLDPRRDGFMLHHTVNPMDERRESFDRLLARLLCEKRLPILAIGAGMQLLNVTMGGNLFLHIPEDLPEALPHRDNQDRAHRHALLVTRETMMDRVYGDGEIRVNSRHHMAIDELADGFIVSARCPDGVIEAIESQIEGWLAVGTQFHPEADTASALDHRIFHEFVEGVQGEVLSVRMVA